MISNFLTGRVKMNKNLTEFSKIIITSQFGIRIQLAMDNVMKHETWVVARITPVYGHIAIIT